MSMMTHAPATGHCPVWCNRKHTGPLPDPHDFHATLHIHNSNPLTTAGQRVSVRQAVTVRRNGEIVPADVVVMLDEVVPLDTDRARQLVAGLLLAIDYTQERPMNTDMELFRHEGHELRTLRIADEPWFVAADVCSMLTLKDTTSAMRLVDDEDRRRLRRSDTPLFWRGIAPQVQEVSLVNESGVYALIFQSYKPEARAFKRWVTHEVLPTIRRTGRFAANQAAPTVDVTAMARQLVIEADRAHAAERRVAELQGRIAGVQLALGQVPEFFPRTALPGPGRRETAQMCAVRTWIKRCTAPVAAPPGTRSRELYEAFIVWNGLPHVTETKFGLILNDLGYPAWRDARYRYRPLALVAR